MSSEGAPQHAIPTDLDRIRSRLVERAFLFEHPADHLAGVDEFIRAIEEQSSPAKGLFAPGRPAG